MTESYAMAEYPECRWPSVRCNTDVCWRSWEAWDDHQAILDMIDQGCPQGRVIGESCKPSCPRLLGPPDATPAWKSPYTRQA